MRILAVADTEDRALAEHFDPGRWANVDLIVSCGDLDPEYLDYLVSRINVPCFYVRGNHDTAYRDRPPGGCEDINGHVVRFGGLRFAGLEGSRWYGGKGVEYHDLSMRLRVMMLRARIMAAGGVDVIVAHAPPVVDPSASHNGVVAVDRVHAGFDSFRDLVLAHQPTLFLHGHTHLNYGRNKREQRIGQTRVIDCYGAHVVDIAVPTAARSVRQHG